VVVALPNAVASKDAAVLQAALEGQHRMGWVEVLCFAVVEEYSMVLAETVRLAKVRVCWVGGWQEDWQAVEHLERLEEGSFERVEETQMRLAGQYQGR
jgi:hypothetical protein